MEDVENEGSSELREAITAHQVVGSVLPSSSRQSHPGGATVADGVHHPIEMERLKNFLSAFGLSSEREKV